MNLSCFQALKLIRQAPSGPGTDHPLSRKKRPGQRRVIRIELPGGGGGRGGRKGADVVREGEGEDEDEDEMREFEERIEKAGLPEHALKAAQKELKVQYIMYVHCIYIHVYAVQCSTIYTSAGVAEVSLCHNTNIFSYITFHSG